MEDNIVITGISGSFPQSRNIDELELNLKNGINLVTNEPDCIAALGKIHDVDKFDARYFGVTSEYADSMDPMGRILLEKVFEAIVDSGYNPGSLNGRNIGVFIGVYLSESEISYFNSGGIDSINVTGVTRCFLANRISYWLGVNGPSLCVDTACSSSLHALQMANMCMKNNECEAAIVGACNLCLNPGTSFNLMKVGVLSPTGCCKIFDEEANGYCRAEAVCAIFLQKEKDARRIYSTVVHAKTNCDGYKPEGITYPSYRMQEKLLRDFYNECNVNPIDVSWLELHATGTKVGDAEEAKAIELFCKGRDSPLKIGSIKSNVGHAEAAAGLCSIAKVIIAMEAGNIPPNINFTEARKDIEGLQDGTMQVITENTIWNGGLVGINSFGLGGANGHVLLKSHVKEKTIQTQTNLPVIVGVSGRTEKALEIMFKDLNSRLTDAEFVSLIHEVYSNEFLGHPFRGYKIVNCDTPKQEIKHFPMEEKPIWFIIPGIGSQWTKMGKRLMDLEVFAESINSSNTILMEKGVDLIDIITSEDERVLDEPLNCFVGITAIQIALVDMLSLIGITADGIIGHSLGEVVCGYIDGCFTREQTILCAYYRGVACREADMISGAMAVIGLPKEEIQSRCSSDIDIACHNSSTSYTISGPLESVRNLVNELKEENVFAKEIESGGIAFHSRYITEAANYLEKYLTNLLTEPKERSIKWITTSTADNENGKYSDVTYHVNNFKNPVLFQEALKRIPDNAIVIEIAPNSLFKNAFKTNDAYIPLIRKENPDVIEHVLEALGKLYLVGMNLKLQKLYPAIEYPVSRSTGKISPLIQWDHDASYSVVYSKESDMTPGERKIKVLMNSKEHSYLFDHVIDDKPIFPGFSYVLLVWDTISMTIGKSHNNVSVVFQKIRFHRTLVLKRGENILFTVSIQRGNGIFEVSSGGQTLVTGHITIPDDINEEMINIPKAYNRGETSVKLQTDDVYKEFSLKGHKYFGLFRQIVSASSDGTEALLKWNNQWAAFLDTAAQVVMLSMDTRNPTLLTSIEKLIINVDLHKQIVEKQSDLELYLHKDLRIIQVGGVLIKNLGCYHVTKLALTKEPKLLQYVFVPYFNFKLKQMDRIGHICAYMLWENILTVHKKIIEVAVEKTQDLASIVVQCIQNYPHIQSSAVIYNKSVEKATDNIVYKTGSITSEESAHLFIANLSSSQQELESYKKMMEDDGFLLLNGNSDNGNEDPTLEDMVKCGSYYFDDSSFVLYRKKPNKDHERIPFEINNNCKFVKPLQEKLNEIQGKKENTELILFSEGDAECGIIGFYNCLKKENGEARIRCVFVMDTDAPKFDLEDPFFKTQLETNFSVNIYKNKQWGTLTHLPLHEKSTIDVHHAYVDVGATGDLRSLSWYQGKIVPSLNFKMGRKMIYVNYAALNFKDVLLTTGVLSASEYLESRVQQECVIGFEFSGYMENGKRCMGISKGGAISTLLAANETVCWSVPKEWSLEEAATVPTAYYTVIAAFMFDGRLKRGETVLIHAGSGGVGQAAINIATYYECEIFVTVGSTEKREFIRKHFPHIPDSHIGNSRNTSFELLVMSETAGRGVDIVLNSLTEDKLQASLRCLGCGGRFLEIGKTGLLKDDTIGLKTFLKGISYHSIVLDYMYAANSEKRLLVSQKFQEEIKNGSVKPIVRTVFNESQVEDAFRLMAAGKHIGKVIIKIREEVDEKYSEISLKSTIPRFNCNPQHVIVICGGLGGMGLELADWLILRGSRNVVLVSRSGVQNGYQAMRIKLWKSYGARIITLALDMTKSDDVEVCLRSAENIAPVFAIFNLVAVIDDKPFTNHTTTSFENVIASKGLSSQHLDRISRGICKKLQYFFVFSSVSCGFGNAFQTNYGYGNSIIERVCEQRRKDNLHALAIQWGAIGDVGLLAQTTTTESLIGFKSQPIRSCLNSLDQILNRQETIVTSYIILDKKYDQSKTRSLIDSVAYILGIRDVKTVSPFTPLPELGMDSFSAMEIKQLLEQEYNIHLTPKEIIGLTLNKLLQIQQNITTGVSPSGANLNSTSTVPHIKHILFEKSTTIDLEHLQPLVKLTSQMQDSNDVTAESTVFLFPPSDGIAAAMIPLANNLNMNVYCFQYCNRDEFDCKTLMHDEAATCIKEMKKQFGNFSTYNLIGYSYGALVALEAVKILSEEGILCKLVLVDTTPSSSEQMREFYIGNITSDIEIQTKVICDVMLTFDPEKLDKTFQNELKKQIDWKSKLEYVTQTIPDDLVYGKMNIRYVMNGLYQKFMAMLHQNFHADRKVNVKAVLIKASKSVFPLTNDEFLSQFFENGVEEKIVDENHFTILNNKKTADIVYEFFNTL